VSKLDSEVKYVFSLLLYFLFLIFVVTIFNAIATDFNLDVEYNATDTNTDLVTQSGAGGFRFAGAGEFGHSHEFLNRDKTPRPYMQLGYIDSEETCEEFVGFEWSSYNGWVSWIPGIEPAFSCQGKLDFDYYDPDDTFNDGIAVGRYTIDNICDLPLLDVGDVNNSARQLTTLFQCQWLEQEFGVYESDSSFSVIWESLKDIFTFNIDFPIEDNFLKFLVNFLIVGIPGIIITVYVIIIIRKLVGFT
jgi:hypothetical protein